MGGILKLSWPATRQYWEVPVLFEDEHLLALDKPSRLLTSPSRDEPNSPSVLDLLRRDIERGAPWAKKAGVNYIANAHRLDLETSGIVIFAKNKPALISLANVFGAEKPIQTYLVLVQGNPPEDTFEVDKKLGPNPHKPGLFRVDSSHGKKARTSFEVIERFGRYTLLKCAPFTNRPHQIRVHSQWLKQPVASDKLYGGRPLLLSRLKPSYRQKPDIPEKPLIARAAVHALECNLPHPATGEMLTLTSSWPRDFTVAVKYLRRFSAG
jgi:23S rRNA pseudouridine955/2504/2580 synthase